MSKEGGLTCIIAKRAPQSRSTDERLTEERMDHLAETIGVVRGASNAEIQDILRSLSERWRRELRLAGVVAEDHGLPDRFCQAGYLRSLATDARFSIFEDLGPGAVECHLDGIGAATASTSVERDIEAGCDL